MLTFVFYYLLFAFGIIAAYIDWEDLMRHIYALKDIKNPKMVFGVIATCMIAYIVIIFVPTYLFYNHFEKQRTNIYVDVGIKKVSARQQIKRRSSWPLAYSNIMMTEKDQ